VNPLRPEPMDKWEQLKDAYQSIFKSEADNYPVHVIQNETTIDAALTTVFSVVRELK